MSFFTLPFFGLLALGLLLYYLLPKKCQWVVLLCASLTFYLWGGLWALAYLLFTAGTTYGAALLLGRWNAAEKAEKRNLTGRKKLAVALCLTLNFVLLLLCKYWNEAAGGLGLPRLSLLMPLGLSFYMFQSTGYVIDCYRGKQSPERNPLKYLLFVSFFPQLVQGPISRFGQLAPQLTAERKWNADNVKYGVQLALWGYLKKLIIADRAAILVQAVFGAPEQYGGAIYAVAVLFYCIQLYCDFSGGIDIARGVAQMFGIDMVENFQRPIFAVSLADYWRRWHITLGTWMRDYVFYPLALSKPLGAFSRWTRKRFGGKLGKVIPTACATFVVYLLIGIWHGASLRYVVFGLYNGAIMTASVLLAGSFSAWRKGLKLDDDSRGLHIFRLLRTMGIVFIGRYLTRAATLTQAVSMQVKTLVQPVFSQLFDGTLGSFGLTGWDYGVIGLGLAILLFAEYKQEHGVKLRLVLERKPVFVQWLAVFLPLLALLLHIVFSGSAVEVTMIYQNF